MTQIRREQPDLDFSVRTHVRRQRHSTEVEAAAQALARAPKSAHDVLDYLKDIWPHGATDEQIEQAGLERRRRSDLFKGNLVEIHGTGTNALGSRVKCWRWIYGRGNDE